MRAWKKDMVVDLKAACLSDLDDFHKLLGELLVDPASYVMVNYLGGVPPKEELAKRASNWNKFPSYLEFGFIDSKLIGYAGATVGPHFGPVAEGHVAEIYYALKGDFRGLGLAYPLVYSLFKRLNVKYVSAYVYVQNHSSIRILENLGLQKVATISEAIYSVQRKQLHDLLLYRGPRETAAANAEKKLAEHGYSILAD